MISKLKEAVICLKAGKVTLPYPFAAEPVPARYRGRPIFNVERCIGCGGCANNCPAREILLSDVCQEIRIMRYLGQRCTYCGRCADVCPEHAITMSGEFETATNDKRDLQQELEVFMGTCQRCGRCFTAPGPLEQLMMKGYRQDDLPAGRWVYKSRSFLQSEGLPDIEIELD
ncbi:MAG: 4Fe-4S dicluster domain-containing protein [Acidobacteria bacterium]|nr:MAG: 4Fe-4S dicluster domain-containing protein [Acidobacteriota bacterium]